MIEPPRHGIAIGAARTDRRRHQAWRRRRLQRPIDRLPSLRDRGTFDKQGRGGTAGTGDDGGIRTVRLDHLAGQVLNGRFELIEIIGTGSSGAVFRARQFDPASEVAVKVLDPDLIQGDPSFKQRFLQEAERYALLRDAHSPHIATIIEYGTDARTGVVYMVTTLLGESVDDLIRRNGPLPASALITMANHVGLALAAVHARGWVHCDVKCSNILLNRDGNQFVLTDFGVAQADDGLQTIALRDAMHGTPRYSAPEVRARDGARPDARADLYALGVVLYRAVTGDFPELTSDITLSRHKSSCPPALRRVIPRLLQADPARRPASIGEFLALLNRTSRLSAQLAGVALAVLVVGLATGGYLWWHSGETLQLASEPAGATYRLFDGAPETGDLRMIAQGTTPELRRRLRNRDYRIEVYLDGHEPLVTTVNPAQPRPGQFPARLPRLLPVTVHSEPAGARFELVPVNAPETIWLRAGPPLRQATPWEHATAVAEGRYTLTVQAPRGYRDLVETYDVGPEGLRADIRLERETGSLYVWAQPPAVVFVDDRRVDTPTPCIIPGLDVGEHRIRLVGPDQFGGLDTLIAVGTDVDTLKHVLAWQGAQPRLEIRSAPVDGAEIQLDGRPTGLRTPAVITTFTPGQTLITLLKDEYQPYRQSLPVPGRGTRFVLTLTPQAPVEFDVRMQKSIIGTSRLRLLSGDGNLTVTGDGSWQVILRSGSLKFELTQISSEFEPLPCVFNVARRDVAGSVLELAWPGCGRNWVGAP